MKPDLAGTVSGATTRATVQREVGSERLGGRPHLGTVRNRQGEDTVGNRRDFFDKVASQAREDEAGGLAQPRAVLLLWYLRNVLGVDALEAYEYICDGTDDWGIDGLYLEKETGASDFERLIVFQSKYLERPRDIGKRDVKGLGSTAHHLMTIANLQEMLLGPIEPRLRTLINDFKLLEKVTEGRLTDGRLRIDLILVTTGFAGTHTTREINATNGAAGRDDYLVVEDIDRLGPVAEALEMRSLLPETLTVSVPATDVLVVEGRGPRIAIVPVRADEIIKWKGIEDRSLFDLNVRRALGRNRVRDELDGAIQRPGDHRDFLAYHNGLTVVCDRFDIRPPGTLLIEHPSVVNGAQSVIAFSRNHASLTSDLRVVVKLVEVRDRPSLAREVSRRSNTQNPVNPRMLMANSGPQLRLEKEFQDGFPAIAYVTRPDEAMKPEGRSINNDDAAQLLCAVYLAQPWLAVKRETLFLSESHAAIFAPAMTAAHVVLADEIGHAVDRRRERLPAAYRASWRLTRIVALYLAGEVLRAGEEAGHHQVLSDPAKALGDAPLLRSRLDDAVSLAIIALAERFKKLGATDDYRKDFKNETVLKGLGSQSRAYYQIRQELPPAPSAPKA